MADRYDGMELELTPMADMELELEALGVTPAQYAALDGRVQANTDSIGVLDLAVALKADKATLQQVIDETTGKDVISAPEIIAARNGESNLKARLDKEHDETAAQLAQTEQQIENNELKPYTVKNLQRASLSPKPVVVFTFDDGAKEDIDVMKPLFDEFGYKFTTYIIAGLIGESYSGKALMNEDELRSLYDDGHEIGSHTMTHIAMSNTPPETVDYEMRESKRVLESLGFEVNNFAYPFGQHDNVAQRISLKYYRTSTLFMSGIQPNTIPINKPAVHRISLGSYFDPPTSNYPVTDTFEDYYKKWVDHALNNNGLTIFALHPWDSAYNAQQMTYLRQTLQYCKDSGVSVLTLDEALDHFDNKLDIKTYNNDSSLKGELLIDANGEFSSQSMIFSKHIRGDNRLPQSALPSEYPKGFTRMEVSDGTMWYQHGGNVIVYTDNSTNWPDAARQWVCPKWNTGISYRSAKPDGTWTPFIDLTPPRNKFSLTSFRPVSTSFDIEPYTTVVYDVPNSVLPWQSIVVANSQLQLPEGVVYTVWNNAATGCKLSITNTSPTAKWIPKTTEFNIKEI